ncbi:MAG: PE-PGRS family protein [Mycobacterium sp.]|nr:PE-PGRS family protein [Mycobacterium sp.]
MNRINVLPLVAAGAIASAATVGSFVSADVVPSTIGNHPVLTSYRVQPVDDTGGGPGGNGCVNGQCGSGGMNGGPGGGPGGSGCMPTPNGMACGSGGVNAGPGGIPGGSGCLPGIGCASGHG